MLFTDIARNFNVLLAGDNLPLKEILPHLDFTIDRINETLNTCYPTMSEIKYSELLGADTTQYTCFPDKFIRTVCLSGAAWHYYVTDEEGLATAAQYQQDFEHALFIMQRDMLYNIPDEYRAPYEQGTVVAAIDHWNLGDRGIYTLDARLM